MTVGLADSLEASGIERRGQIWPCSSSSSSDVNSPSSAARIYNKSELTDWRLMGVIQSVWWRGGGFSSQLLGGTWWFKALILEGVSFCHSVFRSTGWDCRWRMRIGWSSRRGWQKDSRRPDYTQQSKLFSPSELVFGFSEEKKTDETTSVHLPHEGVSTL